MRISEIEKEIANGQREIYRARESLEELKKEMTLSRLNWVELGDTQMVIKIDMLVRELDNEIKQFNAHYERYEKVITQLSYTVDASEIVERAETSVQSYIGILDAFEKDAFKNL